LARPKLTVVMALTDAVVTVPVSDSGDAHGTGTMIRKANATIDPDGVSRSQPRTGCP
jgi:hypothetical protein